MKNSKVLKTVIFFSGTLVTVLLWAAALGSGLMVGVYFDFSIPGEAIREASVVGLMPSNSAAPPSPDHAANSLSPISINPKIPTTSGVG